MIHTSRGFTLVETIIYLAIFSFVSVSAVAIFFSFGSTAATMNEKVAEIEDRMFIESVFRSLVAGGREADISFHLASSTLLYKNTPLHGPRLKVTQFSVSKTAVITEYFFRDAFFEGTTTIHIFLPT
jgi:type II secretory pathway pseudopilin PulG